MLFVGSDHAVRQRAPAVVVLFNETIKKKTHGKGPRYYRFHNNNVREMQRARDLPSSLSFSSETSLPNGSEDNDEADVKTTRASLPAVSTSWSWNTL